MTWSMMPRRACARQLEPADALRVGQVAVLQKLGATLAHAGEQARIRVVVMHDLTLRALSLKLCEHRLERGRVVVQHIPLRRGGHGELHVLLHPLEAVVRRPDAAAAERDHRDRVLVERGALRLGRRP
jgi:hypothetical protein